MIPSSNLGRTDLNRQSVSSILDITMLSTYLDRYLLGVQLSWAGLAGLANPKPDSGSGDLPGPERQGTPLLGICRREEIGFLSSDLAEVR